MLVARHRDETEGPLRKFLAKHAATTTGTLACFDRLLFTGHLPLGYPHAMEVHLTLRKVLRKDWKPYVLTQAERLKAHAHAAAEQAGRPYEYLESPLRKDERAPAIAVLDRFAARSIRSCATSSRAIATTGRRTRPSTPPTSCSRVAPPCAPSTGGCRAMLRAVGVPRMSSPSS